jgi:hypothetical protein
MDKTVEQAQEMAQALHLGIAMGYEDRLEEIIDEITFMAYEDVENEDDEPDFSKLVTIGSVIDVLRKME